MQPANSRAPALPLPQPRVSSHPRCVGHRRRPSATGLPPTRPPELPTLSCCRWGRRRRAGRSRQPAEGETPLDTRGSPCSITAPLPRCGWRGGRGGGGHPRPPAGGCFRRRSRKERRMGMKDAGRGGGWAAGGAACRCGSL